MFNEKVIQGILIFSGISIILLIIPMLAFFITYILWILILWIGTLIFGDNLSDEAMGIISLAILIVTVLYIEYRYIGDILRKFFGRRLSKEEREKSDAKMEAKKRKMEGLFDAMDEITESRQKNP
jgi:hypothetical protein